MRCRSKTAAKGRCAQIPASFAIIEALELRDFKSVTTAINSSFTDLSSYSYYADAQLGDNGDWTGLPALDAGKNGDDPNYAENQWDADLSDGLDSGWVDASFSVDNSTNNVDLSVADQDAISFSSGSSLSIHQVAIVAGVDMAGVIASWRNLSVSFYSGSTLGETISVGSLTADNSTATTDSDKEAIAIVTPSGTGYNHIVVSGQMRLQSNSDVVPGSDSVWCKVAIT